MKTKVNLPPEIIERFSEILLECTPVYRDTSQILEKIYFYITKRLMKKSNYNPKWRAECEKLEEEFIELYERAKIKEKDAKTKEKNKTQEPMYRITFPNSSHGAIFDYFRYASYRTANEFRKNISIQEIPTEW